MTSFEERMEEALKVMGGQHAEMRELVEGGLKELSQKIDGVRDDVITIKAKDYENRVGRLERTAGKHGERISRTEVKSGLISLFVAGVMSYFFGNVGSGGA